VDHALRRLLRTPARLPGTDDEILETFWPAHPRFRFFKNAPFNARLLDIGAGNGGMHFWRDWGRPDRRDIRLFGVDLARGEHADAYEQWEVANLDEGLPRFDGRPFDAFLASHLIEHVADPSALIRAIAARAAPGAWLFLEWPHPMTVDLPGAAELDRELDFRIQTFNFHDDSTHRQTPARDALEAMLAEHGFGVVESGETRLGMIAEELLARGRLRDDMTFRQMGLWSAIGWANYVIARYLPAHSA